MDAHRVLDRLRSNNLETAHLHWILKAAQDPNWLRQATSEQGSWEQYLDQDEAGNMAQRRCKLEPASLRCCEHCQAQNATMRRNWHWRRTCCQSAVFAHLRGHYMTHAWSLRCLQLLRNTVSRLIQLRSKPQTCQRRMLVVIYTVAPAARPPGEPSSRRSCSERSMNMAPGSIYWKFVTFGGRLTFLPSGAPLVVKRSGTAQKWVEGSASQRDKQLEKVSTSVAASLTSQVDMLFCKSSVVPCSV